MSEARASGSTVDRVYTPTVTRVKTVRVIPPTIHPLSDIPAFSARPRRVAAYARVSTSSEEQLTSYEAQVKHYTEYIKSKETSDNWQFVDAYTDKGITGVSTKKREGFNRMIQDALAGRIDLIITKSVSRFARNTVDTLTAIRKLKEHGVEVYFWKDYIRIRVEYFLMLMYETLHIEDKKRFNREMKKKLGKANSHEDELILLDKRELFNNVLGLAKTGLQAVDAVIQIANPENTLIKILHQLIAAEK